MMRSPFLDYRAALRLMFRGSELVLTNGKRAEYSVSPGGPVRALILPSSLSGTPSATQPTPDFWPTRRNPGNFTNHHNDVELCRVTAQPGRH
jgi:hypothetical protein